MRCGIPSSSPIGVSLVLLVIASGGCYLTPRPMRGVFGEKRVAPLPLAVATPVSVPSPPPLPPDESLLFCQEDKEIRVPGQWIWEGRWRWESPSCAKANPEHYVYIWPSYEEGRYRAGYFQSRKDPYVIPERTGPRYSRLAHDPEMALADKQPAAAPAPTQAPQVQPTNQGAPVWQMLYLPRGPAWPTPTSPGPMGPQGPMTRPPPSTWPQWPGNWGGERPPPQP